MPRHWGFISEQNSPKSLWGWQYSGQDKWQVRKMKYTIRKWQVLERKNKAGNRDRKYRESCDYTGWPDDFWEKIQRVRKQALWISGGGHTRKGKEWIGHAQGSERSQGRGQRAYITNNPADRGFYSMGGRGHCRHISLTVTGSDLYFNRITYWVRELALRVHALKAQGNDR